MDTLLFVMAKKVLQVYIKPRRMIHLLKICVYVAVQVIGDETNEPVVVQLDF